jgi:hypothetical protein
MLLSLTIGHTLLSIAAIIFGIALTADLLRGRDSTGLANAFLATALLTSLTGFLFPFVQVLPSHVVAVVALLTLAITLPARYRFRMAGGWRHAYSLGVVINLYLLVFVAIAQAFSKVPALAASAPNLEGPSFAITQALTFALFVAIGVYTARRYRGALPQGA